MYSFLRLAMAVEQTISSPLSAVSEAYAAELGHSCYLDNPVLVSQFARALGHVCR